jgi:hypothetical protein
MRRRGGAPNPASYSDAASFQMANVGKMNTQYDNVFGPNSIGPAYMSQSNALRTSDAHILGGRRRKRSSKKRGGMWGQVINQAIVPFGLLGLQHGYKKRGHSDAPRTRRFRHRRSYMH